MLDMRLRCERRATFVAELIDWRIAFAAARAGAFQLCTALAAEFRPLRVDMVAVWAVHYLLFEYVISFSCILIGLG